MAQKNTKSNPTTSSKKATTTQSSSQEQSMAKSASFERPQDIIETYIIIWLDSNLDFSNKANQEFISRLRSIINNIETFTDIDQCVKFLEQLKNETVFLIISDCFAKQIASLEERFTQLNSIYVFCDQKSKYDEIIKAFRKGKGVFTQMNLLRNELKNDVRLLNNDLISISIVPARSTTNLNELEPSFMYFQLLKDNLLTIEYNHDMEIQQLVDYCRPIYVKNKYEIANIDKFQQEYRQNTPVYWYTLESFLYPMLNHALRTIDIEILIKMGFFIRDLHEQIKRCHLKLDVARIPATVYRGQGMFNNDFEELKKAKGGLISFNNFLSTSSEEHVAKRFACHHNNRHAGIKAILFEIEIDPSVTTIYFTPIEDLTAVEGEEEILFSVSTVFRIREMKETEKNLWKVNLTLTSDRDPLLKRLTDHMQTSLGDGNGWRRLGQLMIKMGQFDKALEIYKILLKTVDLDNKAENAFLHNQLGYVWKQKDNLKEASSHYKKSLDISLSYMSDTDPRLSSTYSNVGGILKKLGNPDEALKWYELVLKIDLAAPEPNQLEIAIDHNNIGSVLDDLGKYSEALKSYDQALDIKLAYLPPHHSSLASTYSNIGLIHRKMGDSSTALSLYKKALEIQEKSLAQNDPSFRITYGKLAIVLEDLHRYKEAIEYAEQAVNIARNAFGPSHQEVENRQQYLEKLRQKT
jgi:tetratricopeptide (TPR) repeat protein